MSLRNRLLVAEPALRDPNFHRTVVYVIEHSGHGALGLVLNRPGEVEVRDAIPAWAPYVNGAERVFSGGPVSPSGAICLARCPNAGPVDDDLFAESGAEDDPFGRDPFGARDVSSGPTSAGPVSSGSGPSDPASTGGDAPGSGAGGGSPFDAVFRPLTTTIGVVDLHADPADAPGAIQELRIFAGYAGWSGGQLELELDQGGWYVLDAQDDDIFTTRPDALWRAVLSRQRGELRARAFFPDDPTWN